MEDPHREARTIPATTETLPSPPKGNKRIFLSWGGQIYGPASAEEVTAGIRASSFEKETLFWHDGLEEWRPLLDFSPPGPVSASEVRPGRLRGSEPQIPGLPARTGRRKTRKKPRGSAPASRRLGRGNRLIFLGIALLAAMLMVGILLLLMLI